MQVPQVLWCCLSFGRGPSAGCGTSGAGRSEFESEGSLHDLPNSLVAVGTANSMVDVDIAVACGEHNLDDHVVEFENLQLAAFAEFGYVTSSKFKEFIHWSSIHACAFSCTCV